MTPEYDENGNLDIEKSMQELKMGDTLLTVMPILTAMLAEIEKLRMALVKVGTWQACYTGMSTGRTTR